jgi:membrane protease subunit (stomatin/prohibitin family)
MQKMKAFTNVVQCIKTKDSVVPIEYCVKEMPLSKGGQIVIKRHFMFHVLFLFVKIISMYSHGG